MSWGIHTHTHTYIYICILNNRPYGKEKNSASDLKMKIYNESLSRGKIYWKKYIWEKKEKANLVITIEKKIKSHAIGWAKEKNTVRAAKLQCKKCSILSRAK